MNTTPPNTVIFVLLLIAVLAVVAWLTVQRLRSLRLRRRFGPQYDLTVSEFHGLTTLETELLDERVARLKSAQLAPVDAARISQEWNIFQDHLIDSPRGVVREPQRH